MLFTESPNLFNNWVVGHQSDSMSSSGVQITGVSELVANAMIFKGEKKRTENLRLEPIPGMEEDDEEAGDASDE